MFASPTTRARSGAVAAALAVATIALSGIAAFVLKEDLAWIRAEWPSALAHLGRTTVRLLEALAWASLAVPVACAMRRWQRLETALTPFVLTATAVPWVLLAIAVNMMIHLRLGAAGAVYLAALGGGSWLLGALGPCQQAPQARYQNVQRAVRVALFMLIAAEVLTLSQGLGSQIRYYVLYWSPPLLCLYGALSVGVIGGALLLGRAISRPVSWLTARLARPHG